MPHPHHEAPDSADQDPTHAGLAQDLTVLLAQQARRREALRWMGLGTAAAATSTWLSSALAAPRKRSTMGSTTGSSGSTGSTSGTTTGTTTGSCSVVPEETAGPYPGDGSNTANGSIANALALSGIVRSDIRSSIAGATGVATGVPLKVVMKLTNASCTALSGYAVYLWHCDAQGRYSMYSSGVTAENYLRGVQSTDSSGTVTFQTIFPGCYSGRMPHMHFEVYRDANTATSFSNKLKTSQLAFDRDVCASVYAADSRYSASVSNLNRITFATDNIFSDGYSLQLTSLTGNATDGYTATITVSIGV